MRVAVVPTGEGGAWTRELAEDGQPLGEPRLWTDLPVAVAAYEPSGPRWVWAHTMDIYPRLLAAGVRVERCHDVELTETLLMGYVGRWGSPRSVAAAWARLTGGPVPPDKAPRSRDTQPTLFDAEQADPLGGADPLEVLLAVHADQLRRIGETALPGRFRLLVAAESAGALAAAEMGHVGLPWRADVHSELLTEMLGPRQAYGLPPRKLGELSERAALALGDRKLHLDSPAEVLKAFSRAGIRLSSTRSWVLKEVDHPAVPLLLEYKELYRIYTAHGWAWLSAWVHDGRFRPEYVPGGVVSGRWATRGGGALQIHKRVRRAAIADPGWVLVVADAGQLEPRVLAALSGDEKLARAGASGDLYRALADEAFGGDRPRAKIGMLAALYGQTSGEAGVLVAALRRKFPRAVDHVEKAAQIGESGGLVRSWLGRTCPPATSGWVEGGLDPEPVEEASDSGARNRARGRFTRNFVVQASAADWALALLATLRTALTGIGVEGARPELVFFQHDEVIVHCRAEDAAEVTAVLEQAAETAGRVVFGDTPARFPLDIAAVECYADAK
ncbi:bifunctional 3'-5' exonuclease/DNA polymerase [Kutzneria sp. CA-103260]|uniref:bifunctional 3'-5' exonuclease/DNA polymerase n=1 Tax=Kutzneria sp. CA-103260 TaxID=2802641 RepID=UPI001BF13A53|nr:bifunctional 3'-5' exonuclease/DNA polymerase [Kutzneria sp. CA-103260]QUQ65020.1 bifunctional 3'-5' exonuclease/DNA polymerase [Kutzneria sp. CA-103260]